MEQLMYPKPITQEHCGSLRMHRWKSSRASVGAVTSFWTRQGVLGCYYMNSKLEMHMFDVQEADGVVLDVYFQILQMLHLRNFIMKMFNGYFDWEWGFLSTESSSFSTIRSNKKIQVLSSDLPQLKI